MKMVVLRHTFSSRMSHLRDDAGDKSRTVSCRQTVLLCVSEACERRKGPSQQMCDHKLQPNMTITSAVFAAGATVCPRLSVPGVWAPNKAKQDPKRQPPTVLLKGNINTGWL